MTYILGSSQTDFARAWSREGLDISDMIRDAVHDALEDAELGPDAIKSIHVGNAFGEAQRSPPECPGTGPAVPPTS